MTTRVSLPTPRPRPGAGAGGPDLGDSVGTRGDGLVDRYGRRATDLRISLIDKCNLRCTYCMPANGLPWLRKEHLLTAEEVRRLVRIGVDILGVTELRLTGGEPLVRQDLEHIIAGIRADHPWLPIALTTNAIGLDVRAEALAQAGLSRVNISLDSVHRETFAALTRRDSLHRVLQGVAAAADVGLTPLKINAVLMRGVNDTQAPELVAWAVAQGCEMRFIEQMPLEADGTWTRDGTVSAAEVRRMLSEHYDLVPVSAVRDSAPAQRYWIYPHGTVHLDAQPSAGALGSDLSGSDALGSVGIIASVTEPFCATCTRTRITAEGKVMSCLFSHEEYDLLALLRDPTTTDDGVARAWSQAMWEKPAAHGTDRPGFDLPTFTRTSRTMSAIGG